MASSSNERRFFSKRMKADISAVVMMIVSVGMLGEAPDPETVQGLVESARHYSEAAVNAGIAWLMAWAAPNED